MIPGGYHPGITVNNNKIIIIPGEYPSGDPLGIIVKKSVKKRTLT